MLIGQDWQVEIRHALREAKQVADFLAKQGAKGSHSRLLLDAPPPEISQMLLADLMAIAFARL